jgi:hypothetical protein
MNGILVLPTRLACGLLLAWLALAAHSDRAELHALRPAALQFQQAGLDHGKNSPAALASPLIAGEDDADRSRNERPDLPLAVRPFVLLPETMRDPVARARSFALVLHAPCAAPQTGPPDLHAA